MINAADKHRTVLVRVRTVVFHGNFVVLAGAFQKIRKTKRMETKQILRNKTERKNQQERGMQNEWV